MSKGESVTGSRMILLSKPVEGEDDRFNEWYDEVHVPEVLDVPGVVAAQRYDLAELKIPHDPDLPAQPPPPTHRYLVICEFDRVPEDVMAGFLEWVMSGKLSLGETLDLTTVSMTGWAASGERQLAN